MSRKLRQAFAATRAYDALVTMGARVWPTRDGLFATDREHGPFVPSWRVGELEQQIRQNSGLGFEVEHGTDATVRHIGHSSSPDYPTAA